MNISCEIIRDLLPLYVDGVCSDDSRNAVEQHIDGCEACSEELRLMKSDNIAVNVEEMETAKAVGKVWKRSKLRSMIAGILVALTMVGAIYGLTVPNIVPVDESHLEVQDIWRMEDGNIHVELVVTDGKKHNFFRYRTKDGAFYITPMQPIINTRENTAWDAQKNRTIHNIGGAAVGSALYLGWGDNAILVWEEGMELPPAPTYVETEWAEMRGR